MPKVDDELAGRIKQLLDETRIKQSELAQAVGRGQPTVSLWLSGQRKPSLSEIVAIADYLGASPAWLAFGINVDNDIDETRLQRAVDVLAKLDPPAEERGKTLAWVYRNIDDKTASSLIDALLKKDR